MKVCYAIAILAFSTIFAYAKVDVDILISAESYKVPEPYVWARDDSFSVFYDNLDDEHKAIFEAIFDCCKDPLSAPLIAKLCEVTEVHFADEERMMKEANFPDFVWHKTIHNDFLGKIKTLKAPLDSASLTWVKHWVVSHIKGVDFKYKGKL